MTGCSKKARAVALNDLRTGGWGNHKLSGTRLEFLKTRGVKLAACAAKLLAGGGDESCLEGSVRQTLPIKQAG